MLAPLGLVVVGTVAVIGWRLEQKRRDRVLADALGRAWLFEAEDPSLVDAFPGEPFGQGDGRQARTVLRGRESGRDFVTFDYSYETHWPATCCPRAPWSTSCRSRPTWCRRSGSPALTW